MQNPKLTLLLSFVAVAVMFFLSSTCNKAPEPKVNGLDTMWALWRRAYAKEYQTPAEEQFRMAVFARSVAKVQALNSEASAIFGLTVFADLTEEEFKSQKLGLKLGIGSEQYAEHGDRSTAGLPDSLDWRTKGAVTPVKDQGRCGSCWAFSTTGNLEGLYFLNKNQLLSFSEQMLVDCSFPFGNDGCDGGLPTQAIDFVVSGGIQTEADYPYLAVNMMCQPAYQAFTWKEVSGQVQVPKNDNDALLNAASLNPVSVGIDATGLQYYKSGIFGDKCGKNIDHAVLVVGWGSSDGTDYWLVKNSWGVKWGENGYFRLKRIKGVAPAPCAVSQLASYATVGK